MKYRRASTAAWRTIAGETVVLDLESKRVYGLNPSGGLVWSAIGDGADIKQLMASLAGSAQPSFQVDTVEQFCSELAELGLLSLLDPEVEKERAPPPESRAHPDRLPLPAAQLAPPAVAWQEPLQQPGGTCAFLPAQNPLCTQVPFS